MDKATHIDEDNDGNCDVCGATVKTEPVGPDTPVDPDDPVNPEPTEKTGLSGGAIAGITIGSVAVVGLGGFSLFWFVIKKKKWADLIAIIKKK